MYACMYVLVPWFHLKYYTMPVCYESVNLTYVRHTIELQRVFSLCTVSDHILFT